ncbi:MAG: GW dipeptide domain-containing protein [Bacillota bacterium]
MKRSLFLVLIIAAFGLSACNKKEEPKAEAGTNAANAAHSAKVLDKIDASNYSYLQVSENNSTYWIAVPQMPVQKGETVQFSKSMEMKNFHSETLNRTWESILFVSDCVKEGHGQMSANGGMQMHPQVTSAPEKITVDPVKGGKTVAEIFSQKKSLEGKTVKVRGKVTKYNPGIMDRNWIHLQDGTNDAGAYDLMVTSTQETQLGSIITVEGKVSVNKDFGAGYSYPVIVEDAKISK